MNARPEYVPSVEDSSGIRDAAGGAESEPARDSAPALGGSRPFAEAEPKPSLEVLRRKLDAAIVAEAWDAVKAIRDRMGEVEREAAGNVLAFPARR